MIEEKIGEVEDKKKTGFFTKLFKKDFFKKLKSIKHIEYIIAVVLGLIVLLIFFSSTSEKSSSKSTENTKITDTTSDITLYTQEVESRIVKVLKSVKNVGNIEVMIMVESSPEIVLAESLESKSVKTGSNENETITIISDPFTVQNGTETEVVVLVQKAPKITGVLVVSSGAKDPNVKLALLSAVEVLLSIDAQHVQILVGD